MDPELSIEQWIQAFEILHGMGVRFNLILGNETWALGEPLIRVIETLMYRNISYALYTTCFKKLFKKHRENFFLKGIDNLSCGVDYPYDWFENDVVDYDGLELANDMERKSWLAWDAFKWVKRDWKSTDIDCQGTITMHRKNALHVPKIIRQLSDIGVFSGLNIIHYNKDGQFDLFPYLAEIHDMCFIMEEDWKMAKYVFNQIKKMREDKKNPILLQNPDIYDNITFLELNMGWHCHGDPYGGPTIDADGSLRCCGYRKGSRTPAYSIFDLKYPKKRASWEKAMKADALDCPGCCWSYPMMWKRHAHNPEHRQDVFARHGGEHIPKERWSNWR
jgi:MoaA/NifB/PqqE/SkfB family radical SAM enzyme